MQCYDLIPFLFNFTTEENMVRRVDWRERCAAASSRSRPGWGTPKPLSGCHRKLKRIGKAIALLTGNPQNLCPAPIVG
jgi:hypothetical protein